MDIPIIITGKNFKLTPAIKYYVNEKIGRLQKYSREIQRLRVELDVDHNVTKGLKNRVEVWVYLRRKTLLTGLKAEHMREAIDLVYPKIERRLISYLRKTRDKKRGTRV